MNDQGFEKAVLALGASAAAMNALATAIQEQTVALHALADAIAAPVEDVALESPRATYLDGSPIED